MLNNFSAILFCFASDIKKAIPKPIQPLATMSLSFLLWGQDLNNACQHQTRYASETKDTALNRTFIRTKL